MLEVNGKTGVYGVIGNPIAHTKSPFIHHLLAEKLKINMAYLPFPVVNDVEAAISGAHALGINGLNVTVPHKMRVMESLDEIDDLAKEIGAVNTIHFDNEMKIGYNTDIIGLTKDLTMHQVDINNQHVCILGAGGAANSVAFLAAHLGAKRIDIVNRTVEKAVALGERVKAYYDVEVNGLSYEDSKEFGAATICFQTTSVGMHPHTGYSPIDDINIFKQLLVAVDIIYNPKETKFLKDARKMNAQTINGLGMLYYQAVASFEIWHNITVSDDIAIAGYQEFKAYIYKNMM